uniref:Uncharacterized protein n=1 Tax=Anopheles culicifacies TaxID=139723 RepID=A0A182MPB0_9DIPT
MWYLVLLAVSATIYFVAKRWGRQLYYRWGRLIPFRRAIVNKSRPPTPPLIDTGVSTVPGGVSGTGEEGYPLLSTKEEFDDDRLHTTDDKVMNERISQHQQDTVDSLAFAKCQLLVQHQGDSCLVSRCSISS